MFSTDRNTQEFWDLKLNIKTFNKILRKSIRIAKSKYYKKCFLLYKGEMKDTWNMINEVLNNTVKKKSFPEYVMVDGVSIKDNLLIANHFNKYYVNIGLKLVNEINSPANTNFMVFSINKTNTIFTFSPIDEEYTGKLLDCLKNKTSCGVDMISNKLLKTLKPVLTGPLTIIINQSLSKGIFPSILKTAKVIPLFKSGPKHDFHKL